MRLRLCCPAVCAGSAKLTIPIRECAHRTLMSSLRSLVITGHIAFGATAARRAWSSCRVTLFPRSGLQLSSKQMV